MRKHDCPCDEKGSEGTHAHFERGQWFHQSGAHAKDFDTTVNCCANHVQNYVTSPAFKSGKGPFYVKTNIHLPTQHPYRG